MAKLDNDLQRKILQKASKDATDQKKPSKTKLVCSLLLVLSAQVKSEYAKLNETLGAVTQERDLALWERNQLQDKLENLEQVLKVRKPSLSPLSVNTACISSSGSPSVLGIPNSGVFYGT